MITRETQPGMLEIIHENKVLAYAVLDVSGFYYIEFKGEGWFEPHTLRQIADLVDGLNFNYEQELKEYFSLK